MSFRLKKKVFNCLEIGSFKTFQDDFFFVRLDLSSGDNLGSAVVLIGLDRS